LKVNSEKRYVRAEGGVTLQRLHAALAARGLAMINLGSISEQTLAGMLTTATHGTGVEHKVLSTHVQSVRLLLANGAKVVCSRDRYPELFFATLCGLGSTGIILDVRMEVTQAFRLREVQETFKFDDVIDHLNTIVRSAEFVRLWWWPQGGDVRVSVIDKTQEVRGDTIIRSDPEIGSSDLLVILPAQAPAAELALAFSNRVSRYPVPPLPGPLYSSL
jgi:L-gulonolactone oxidase